MTLTQSHAYISPEEYLELEKNSPIKHEYIQGQIYAMAGASDAHVTITANLVALLRNHIMVTCDPRDTKFEYFKCYPSLIIEVLSPATEALDRGDKFIDYQELETLKEYVLVSQNRQRVDRFSLNDEGRWELYSYRVNQQLELTSVNFKCLLTDVYEDVNFLR